MLVKRKKTRILTKSLGSKRFWTLASIRRQSKKKRMSVRIRSRDLFYNLKLITNTQDMMLKIGLVEQSDKQ